MLFGHLYRDTDSSLTEHSEKNAQNIFFAGLIFKMRINLKIRMTILSGNLNMIKNN